MDSLGKKAVYGLILGIISIIGFILIDLLIIPLAVVGLYLSVQGLKSDKQVLAGGGILLNAGTILYITWLFISFSA